MTHVDSELCSLKWVSKFNWNSKVLRDKMYSSVNIQTAKTLSDAWCVTKLSYRNIWIVHLVCLCMRSPTPWCVGVGVPPPPCFPLSKIWANIFAYIKIIKNPKHLEILDAKQNSQGRKSNFKMQMFNCAVSIWYKGERAEITRSYQRKIKILSWVLTVVKSLGIGNGIWTGPF